MRSLFLERPKPRSITWKWNGAFWVRRRRFENCRYEGDQYVLDAILIETDSPFHCLSSQPFKTLSRTLSLPLWSSLATSSSSTGFSSYFQFPVSATLHFLPIPLAAIFHSSTIALSIPKLAPMTELSEDAQHIEKLYEFGERLNEAEDKSQVSSSFSLSPLSFSFFYRFFFMWSRVLILGLTLLVVVLECKGLSRHNRRS